MATLWCFLCINEIDKNLNQEKQMLHCCHRVMWLSHASLRVSNDIYGEFVMLRLVSVSALCLGLLAGCATTKNLVDKVSSPDTPLATVLKERPDLVKELSTVEIRQFFNSVEAPTAAQVKVTETGLMDDSIRSVRTIYSFKHVDNDWKLIETEKSYQCMRGKNTKNFQTEKCS